MYATGELGSEPPSLDADPEGPVPAWKLEEQNVLLDKMVRLNGKGELLDVGCFVGTFLTQAKRRGFGVAGIEPNRIAFQYVRDILHFDVCNESLASVNFPNESFSAVSFLDVIEHVPDPVEELKLVWNVLRPGGVLVLTTPNVAGLPQRIVKAARNLSGRDWCPIDEVPWHLWGFTRRSLALCVERAGFEVKEILWLKPSPWSTNQECGVQRMEAFSAEVCRGHQRIV